MAIILQRAKKRCPKFFEILFSFQKIQKFYVIFLKFLE